MINSPEFRKERISYQYQLIIGSEEKGKVLKEYGLSESQIDPDKLHTNLVLAAVSQGKRIGIAHGIFCGETSEFIVGMVMLQPEYRSASSIRDFLRMLLGYARQEYPCSICRWYYLTQKEQLDPYEKIVYGIPEFSVEVKLLSRQYRVNLQGFHHRGDTYTEKHLQAMGYRVIHRSEMTDRQTRVLQELCANADKERADLHPFVSDYDEETSLLLVDLATEQVCAWMICRRRGKQLLEVRRWCALPSADRKSNQAGLYLAGYWIRLISEKYDEIVFYVIRTNETMIRFVNAYFKNAIQKVYYKKEMIIRID
jgi:hypothetical protein